MNNVSVKAHREEKDQLRAEVGKKFITNFLEAENLGLSHYNYEYTDIKVQPLEEYPIPISIGKNRIGGNNVRTSFMDVVYILNPGNASIFRNECFTIGVEIKISVRDLYRNPLQINSYFGKTDYMFLCVPQIMINEALQYAYNEDRLGIFSLDTGEIHKFPIKQQMDAGWSEKLLLRALFADSVLSMMRFKPE